MQRVDLASLSSKRRRKRIEGEAEERPRVANTELFIHCVRTKLSPVLGKNILGIV